MGESRRRSASRQAAYVVTEELAGRYGLDLAMCQGAPVQYSWQREEYVVRAGGTTPPQQLRAVRVSHWKNFGNMVFQLRHAVAFAEKHKIPVISGPENPWFRSGEVGDVRLAFGRPVVRPRLVGGFFYRQPLGLAWSDRSPRHIRELRRLFVLHGERARFDDDLVIHLRSGDVFGEDPHPVYWPPPLAYYLRAIEMMGAESVRVVSQDWKHPLLEPLRRWCAERGVAFAVQVSDLREDLLTLTSARRLCLSQGTMGAAAAWLSSTVETVIRPDSMFEHETAALGIETYTAQAPDWPKEADWTASEEQVAGLLTSGQETRFARIG